MDQKTYLTQSAVTCTPDNFELNFEQMYKDAHEVLTTMTTGVAISTDIDAVKRSLFYGDPKLDERLAKSDEEIATLYNRLNENRDIKIPADKIGLLHAALGMFSEAGEVIKEVVDSILDNRPVDVVNLEEEGGDQCWYIALMLRELQKLETTRTIDFETTMAKNIAKLQARYPNKFNSEDAVNRNLDEERSALTSGN